MKKYAFLPILALATTAIVSWQGIVPQICHGRGGEGTHVALRKGWVDQVGPESVVIDDMSYRATAKTRYHSTNGKAGRSATGLRVGQFVGFVADNGVLTDVYILEPGREDMRPETRTSPVSEPAGNSEIILEDGVWRN